jgi:hypothetical protein
MPSPAPGWLVCAQVAALLARLDLNSHANSNGVGSGLLVGEGHDMASLVKDEGLAAVLDSGLVAAVAAAADASSANDADTRAAAFHALAQLAGEELGSLVAGRAGEEAGVHQVDTAHGASRRLAAPLQAPPPPTHTQRDLVSLPLLVAGLPLQARAGRRRSPSCCPS